jgi:hypothetical protein
MATDTFQVFTAPNTGPYIFVPADQIDEVSALLDAHDISYWVDEWVISIDDEPETTVFNLKQGTDAAAVQKILDAQMDLKGRSG